MLRKFKYIVLFFLGIFMSTCSKKSNDRTFNYYYRNIIAPEGEEQGTVLKISFNNTNNIDTNMYMIKGHIYDDSLSLDMVEKGKNRVNIKEKDWKIFRDFTNCIYQLPIEKWEIKGDSLFIRNALYKYPDRPSKIKWRWFYSLQGEIDDKCIKGILTENHYNISWDDTSKYNYSNEVTFIRQP